MWKLTHEALEEHPHVEAVTAWCQVPTRRQHGMAEISRAAVTAIDNREPLAARVERRDGAVIDIATMPFPDGQRWSRSRT